MSTYHYVTLNIVKFFSNKPHPEVPFVISVDDINKEPNNQLSVNEKTLNGI
jgi:hypothetical protein